MFVPRGDLSRSAVSVGSGSVGVIAAVFVLLFPTSPVAAEVGEVGVALVLDVSLWCSRRGAIIFSC